MSRIGIAGLGKLGLPIALVVARKGHSVIGYDPSPAAAQILSTRIYPHREIKAQEYLESTTLRLADSVAQLVAESDVILCLVQTPHHPQFEGVTRLPEARVDFDYSYLRASVAEIAGECARQCKRVILTVMSTVLPGTVDREIKPLLHEYTPLCYSPAFPAMGTAIPDFEEPEFYLLGVDDPGAAQTMEAFYKTIAPAPVVRMSVRSAEAVKVFYNSALTTKLQLANTWMEMCHHLGGNVDDVTRALSLAGNRLISPKYMRGGMGDGGGCHPRDLIALSHVARRLGMSYDWFGDLAIVREKQTEWLARMAMEEAGGHYVYSQGDKRADRELPIVVLGKAFKAGTNLTTGSPAALLLNILADLGFPADRVSWYDPHVDGGTWQPEAVAVYFIATNHPEFYGMTFPASSIIIDPWGLMADREGCKVVRVGRDAKRDAA